MAETIEIGCDGTKKWMWFNVANDLEKQGGLTEVLIDPLSVCASGCGGEHEKNHFYITWIHDLFLLVTMQTFSQALVDAFSKVVEYRPFCRYTSKGNLETIEWDKKDPDSRFAELQNDSTVKNLVRL